MIIEEMPISCLLISKVLGDYMLDAKQQAKILKQAEYQSARRMKLSLPVL